MVPAAVLKVLVQAQGIAATVADLKRVNDQANRTANEVQRFGRIRAVARVALDGTKGVLGDVAKVRAELAFINGKKVVADVKAKVSGWREFTRLKGAIGDATVGLGPFRTSLRALPAILALGSAGIGSMAAALVVLVGAAYNAIKSLAGLAGAGAVAASALGQAFGTVKLATMGVSAALKEQAQAHLGTAKQAVSSATQQRAAARAVQSAQDGVRSAHEGVTRATQQLTDAQHQAKQAQAQLSQARIDARRQLQDMRATVTTTANDEERATLALKDARKALTNLQNGPTVRQLAAANEAVSDSLRGEKRATLDLYDAQQRLKALMSPPDALDLADAQDAVADAIRGQKQAALDLADAQKQAAATMADPNATAEDRAKAQLQLADAQNAVGDAARETQRAQQQLADLEKPASQQDIAKARLDVKDAEDAVRDAKGQTADAQRKLDKLTAPAKDEAIKKAKLAVAEAEQQLADATRAHTRAQQDLTRAEKKGVDGSDQVRQAEEAVRKAHEGVKNAEQGVKDAHLQVTRASEQLHDAQLNQADAAKKSTLASDGLRKAMNQLPVPAQKFVKQLLAMQPKLDTLRATAAKGLFPGVIDGLHSVLHNFDPVNRVVGKTAGVLGDLARKAGDLIGSKGFGHDLETIGDRNAKIIGRVGDAAIHAASALRHILVAAGPLTSWLAKLVDGWARNADQTAKANRENGKLAAYFDHTRQTVQKLGHFLNELRGGISGFFAAANRGSTGFAKSITHAAERFNDWAHSARGQNEIRQMFDRLIPLAKRLGGTLVQLVRTLGNFSAATAPAAALFVSAFGSILGVVNKALKAIQGLPDGLQTVIGMLLLLSGPIKVVKLLAGGIGTLKTAFLAVKDACILTRIQLAALWIVEKAGAIASGALAAATWLVNAAMDANPIGLVVLAIAALVAAVVVIITHFKTFKKIVGDVWDWLKGAVRDTWDWIKHHLKIVVPAALLLITGPIGAIVGLIATHWSAIKRGVHDVWDAIKGFLGNRWQDIKSIAATVWGAIRHAITDPISAAWTWLRGAVGGIVGFLGDRWGDIKGAARSAWGFVHDHIVGPIRDAIDAVKGVIGHGGKDKTGLVGWLLGAWSTITGGIKDFAGNVKDKITGVFRGVVNTVIGFVNKIIGVINKIPGVEIPKIKLLAAPTPKQENLGQTGHLARGGAFARTGGLVDRPITLMGEEAPVHPEIVVPTNPAYRGRARMLAMMAAKAVGLASGGVFSHGALEDLWKQANPGFGNPNVMAALAQAESGGWPLRNYGEPPPGRGPAGGDGGRTRAAGLWQILGLPFPGNVYDAFTNARMAGAKLRLQGLGAWSTYTNGAYKHYLGGGGIGGFLKGIGQGALSLPGKALGLLADGGKALLGALPNPADLLPDWLRGMGSFLVKKVGGFIKDKIGSLLSFGGGPSGKPGGGGLGSFDGLPVANWIVPILNWAQQHGWHGRITSGYRPPGQVVTNAQGLVAPQGHSNHNFTAYPGGAIDVGDPGARAAGAALAAVLAGYPGGRHLVWGGPVIGDWGHFSATGHRKGGIYGPYIGSYKNGTDYVPRDGFAYLHKGEQVNPAGGTRGPLLQVNGDLVLNDPGDLHRELDRIAFLAGS